MSKQDTNKPSVTISYKKDQRWFVEIDPINHPCLYWRALEGEVYLDSNAIFVHLDGDSVLIGTVHEGVDAAEADLFALRGC